MGIIRNLVILGLGYFAFKAIRKAMDQADNARVKAKADEKAPGITKLKQDPVTGVYRPEA